MYTISKQFTFSASHRLLQLPMEHPCFNMHGHNYVVTLTLASMGLNMITEFVVDYRELDEFKKYLDENFDHQHLNDVVDFTPTAELLAHYFFSWCKRRWPQTIAVSVSETPKTMAEYRDESQ